MLISVHLPKTAGLSFRASLEEHYGERFHFDYADYPLNQAEQDRHSSALSAGQCLEVEDFRHVSCIHGHFLPVKYRPLEQAFECRYITWMREPVARLISHYHYWFRSYDPQSPETSALHRRVVEEQWTLEQFCLSEELRNVYSAFLWRFPLEHFEFIGITEFFDEELRYFSTQFLGAPMQPHHLNARDTQASGDSGELSPELRREVLAFHAADNALYQQALEMRHARV